METVLVQAVWHGDSVGTLTGIIEIQHPLPNDGLTCGLAV